MLRTLCALVVALMVTPVIATEPSADESQVAIIYFDQLKKRDLEGNCKNIRLMPVTGSPVQTPYVRLVNESFAEREITVRIMGLTETEYDLYIIGTDAKKNMEANEPPPTPGSPPRFVDLAEHSAGKKTKEELESGIQVYFPGTLVPAEYREHYSRIRARAIEGAKRYEPVKDTDKDADICWAVMGKRGIAGWVDRIEQGDERIRTVTIVVVPAGRSFSLPGGGILPAPPKFLNSVKRLADTIQIARRDVSKLVKNETYRYDTLEIITPIDFELVPTAFTPGKKVTVRARLTNWTDRIISGKVRLYVPSGWTVREVSPKVEMAGYRKTAEATFEVTVPANAKTNAAVSAGADLTLRDPVEDLSVKLHARMDRK